MNYLISYNRSGNTWLRYIIECLTKQPTIGHQVFSIHDRLDIKLSGDSILIKRHEIIENEITDNDSIILLLRDYHYCIYNSMNCKDEKFKEEFDKYIKLIDFYDKFNGKKMLIRYEKFINNEKEIILNLLSFLNIKNVDLKFFDNIEEHKETCFLAYKNETKTKGKEVKLNISVEEEDKINNYIKKYSNFDKYIATYRTF